MTYVRPLPGHSAVERGTPPSTLQVKAVTPLPPRRRRRRRRRTGLWVFFLLLALTLGLTVGARIWEETHPSQGHWSPFTYDYDGNQKKEPELLDITIPTFPIGQGGDLPVERDHGPALTAQEIYRQVNPSVVTVLVQLENALGLGTGVIFTQDGYILTNYHVLEGGRDCTVTLEDNRSFAAQYVAGDQESDLAVLKVDLENLPAASFGDSDDLVVGDRVYAIGNPLGIELRGTLTDGIISAINRDVRVDGKIMNLLQTNAALNSGNSGGPLINAFGQVVGINTVKMSSSYSSIEGLGFAIPSSAMQYLVRDLLTYGEIQPEPLLGVSVSKVGTQLEGELWGVEVLEVTTGSASAAADVRVGDFIIAAAGRDVMVSEDLLRARRQFHVGDKMPLTLWRNGEQVDVMLQLNQTVQ